MHKPYTTRIWLGLIWIALLSGCVSSGQKLNRLAVTPVKVINSNSFSDIASEVSGSNQNHRADRVLVVLDIDNTILTSNVDLGSDIWYQWQRSSLEIIPSTTQKVDCLFEDAIGLLYELNPLILTEDSIPKIISRWQNNGNHVIALTSRSPRYRAATERELLNKGIDLSKTAITEYGKTGVVYRERLTREISYMNGIMMTSGMDKGKMLKHLISKVSKSSNKSPIFEAIVFVDDSSSNVQDMHEAYKNIDDIELTAIHYTRVEEQRKQKFGAVLTQEQANKMDEDWKSLTAFLNQLFPRRQIGTACIAN